MSKEYEPRVKAIITETISSGISKDFYDAFDTTLDALWVPAGTVGYTVDTNAAAKYRGVSGMRVLTRVATPAINDYASVYRRFAKVPAKQIKFSGYFEPLENDAQNFDFIIQNEAANALGLYTLRFDATNEGIQILHSTGTKTIIAMGAGYFAGYIYCSLTIDLINNRYVELYVGSTRYDISDLIPATGGGAVGESLFRVTAKATDLAGVGGQGGYIDEFRVEFL